jgi:hypothetical protein
VITNAQGNTAKLNFGKIQNVCVSKDNIRKVITHRLKEKLLVNQTYDNELVI